MLRAPLLHFFVIGALLFGVERISDGGRTWGFNRDTLRVDVAEQSRITRDLQAELRRAPNAVERSAAVNQWIDDEMLYREALRLGIDQRDSVVRSRLIQNMRFAGAADGSDAAALLQQAQRLGMARSDLVVRRRLVQLMQRRLVAKVRVSSDEARRYLTAHVEAYTPAQRYAFTQVFVNADLHRHDLDATAKQIAATLVQQPAHEDLGDPFLLGNAQAWATTAELASRYGADFAQGIEHATPGIWSGPLRSVYGLHFVRVAAQAAPAPANDAQALRAASFALLEQRQRDALREALAALRKRYVISIDPPPLRLGDAR